MESVVIVAPGPMMVGQTLQLYVILRDGKHRLVTRAVSFTSTDQSIATVDSSGIVTARLAGEATIVATSEGKSGYVTLKIIPFTSCGWWDYENCVTADP